MPVNCHKFSIIAILFSGVPACSTSRQICRSAKISLESCWEAHYAANILTLPGNRGITTFPFSNRNFWNLVLKLSSLTSHCALALSTPCSCSNSAKPRIVCTQRTRHHSTRQSFTMGKRKKNPGNVSHKKWHLFNSVTAFTLGEISNCLKCPAFFDEWKQGFIFQRCVA